MLDACSCAVIFFLIVPAQAATVYKCTGQDGKVLFSQQACPGGQAGEAIRIAPANAMDNSANNRQGLALTSMFNP